MTMINGGEWAVTEDSVDELKQLSGALGEVTNNLKNSISTLKDAFEDNASGLGAHSDDIAVLIENMNNLVFDTETIVNKLSFKILKAAAVRQAHIDNNPYYSQDYGGVSLEVASFVTDISGIKSTMSLGAGDSSVKQLAGIHKEVQKNDGPGFESHHIPSAAALKEFGIDTKNWPTIALTKEDHAKTDSYRYKQQRSTEPFFRDAPKNGTYKEESVKLLDRPGGLFELVRDEIYNIREQCGDKYDGAISQYLDQIVEYVKKHGVPNRK